MGCLPSIDQYQKSDSSSKLVTVPTVFEHKITNKSIPAYNYMHKIVIMGDACVGKSALLKRLTEDIFEAKYTNTIGVDFGIIMIDQKQGIKQQIWDLAGGKNFRSIIRSYYRNALGFVVCFDLTNRESFNNIRGWLEEIGWNSNLETCINVSLVGLKTDLVSRRVVTEEDAKDLVAITSTMGKGKNFKITYQELSVSKSPIEDIVKCFQDLSQRIVSSGVKFAPMESVKCK